MIPINGMTFGILHAHLDLQISLAHTVCYLQPRVFCRIELKLVSVDSLRARQHIFGSRRSVVKWLAIQLIGVVIVGVVLLTLRLLVGWNKFEMCDPRR